MDFSKRVIKKQISLHLVLFSLLTGLLSGCFDEATNPDSADYKGDYRLDIESFNQDTLLLFNSYNCYFETGEDEFDTIYIDAARENVLNMNLFRVSTESDSLEFYFTAPYSGDLTIKGIRPNEKVDSAVISVLVMNPFSISGPDKAALGDSLELKISSQSNEAAENVKKVFWSKDGLINDTLNIDEEFIFEISEVKQAVITASVKDFMNNAMELDTFFVSVPGVRPEIVSASFSEEVFGPGDSLMADILINTDSSDTGTLYIVTMMDSSVVDTASLDSLLFSGDSSSIKVNSGIVCTDTGMLSASFYYQSKEGFISNVVYDSTSIQTDGPVLSFSSDSVNVAPGIENSITVNGTALKYIWRVTGTDDSIVTSVPLLEETLFEDGAGSKTVSVYGIDQYGYAGESVSITVTGVDYPYIVELSSEEDSVAVNDTMLVSAVVIENTQSAGTWDSLHWVAAFGSDTLIDSVCTDTFMRVAAAKAGLYTVSACVVDEDEIASLDASAQVEAISTEPLITGFSLSDDDIYSGDSVDITFVTEPGFSGSPVESLFVDLDGDTTVWEAVSSEMTVEIELTGDGWKKFSAVCRDGDGSQSPLFTDSIQVGGGFPEVDSVLIVESGPYYTNTELNFNVFAHDINSSGSVVRYRVVLQNAKDTINQASGLSTVSVVLGSGSDGRYSAGVSVKDDDGNWSSVYTMKDSIDVFSDVPVVDNLNLISEPPFFINENITFSIDAHDDLGSIDSFELVFEGAGSPLRFVSVSEPFNVSFSAQQAGEYDVSARVIDDNGQWSEALNLGEAVAISSGTPVLTAMDDDTVYSNETLSITASASDNGSIVSYLWALDGSSFLDTTQTGEIEVTYTSASVETVIVKAVDNDGVVSEADTVIITVEDDTPVADSVVLPSGDLYVNEDLAFTVHGHDVNPSGSIDSFKVLLTDGSTEIGDTSASNSITLQAGTNQSGSYDVKIQVMDNNGQWSDVNTYEGAVTISAGEPVVTAMDDDTVYAHEDVTVTASASDNGTVESFIWELSGAPVDTTSNGEFQTSFASAGDKVITVKAVDNDGFESESDTVVITVESDTPVADSVTLPSGDLYVNDDLTFIVHGHDVNPSGSIDSFKVLLRDGSTEIGDITASSSITLQAGSSQNGTYSVEVQVKDNNGQWSDVETGGEVTIEQGIPEESDLTFSGTVWINDEVTYNLTASDVNENLVSVLVEWRDGTDTTITVDSKQSIDKSITHVYEKGYQGTNTVKITATDNDGFSSIAYVPVEVHQGAPVITLLDSAGYCEISGGTIYASANLNSSGDPRPRIYFSAMDSNGTIQGITVAGGNRGICWMDIDGDGTWDQMSEFIYSNPDTSYFNLSNTNFPNDTIVFDSLYEDVKIWCWDDDSNKTELTYDLYIDGPPLVGEKSGGYIFDTLRITSPRDIFTYGMTPDSVSSQFEIEWQGLGDVRDGDTLDFIVNVHIGYSSGEYTYVDSICVTDTVYNHTDADGISYYSYNIDLHDAEHFNWGDDQRVGVEIIEIDRFGQEKLVESWHSHPGGSSSLGILDVYYDAPDL